MSRGNYQNLDPAWRDDHPERGEPAGIVCRDQFDVGLLREDFERTHKMAGDRRQWSFRAYKRDVRLDGARFYLYFVVIRRKPKTRSQP